MSSFDEQADNLLQAIDKEWNQNVEHDELVLAFTVGANFKRGLPPSLIQVKEVTPSIQNILDVKSCSYLDCSGIQFGTSTDSTFTSLVILNRYLEKVKFAKVLIFIPYSKLTEVESGPDSRNSWSSSIFSCPAIHLLLKISETLKPISFGLVVIQDAESEQSGKNFEQLFIEQIHVVLNNRFVEDPSPQLQLHLDFLKLITRKEIEFVIVPLQCRCYATVENLVDLKLPSGNAIIAFHQQYVRVTDKIYGKHFLFTLKKVHDGQHFIAISNRLQNQLIQIINQLIISILDSVLTQYAFETTCLPKRKCHAVELVERLSVALDFCISSGSFVEFMKLINLLDYPLDTQLHEKLSTHFVQLKSIIVISNVLDIDVAQRKCQVSLKKECKIFHEKVRKEIFPVVAADLQNERQEICTILQSAYEPITDLITQTLIDFYRSKFLPENLSFDKSRQNAIELLCKDEALLETVELMMLVEPEKNSPLQVAAYEKLCKKPGYELCFNNLLEDVNQLKILEDRHKSVDRALQIVDNQYNSSCGCVNHSASSIFRKIKKHVNEVKGILIRCSEVVQEIKSELDSFFTHIVITFEKEQICTGLDMESLPEKLNKINCSLEILEDWQLTCGRFITELECISDALLLNRNFGSGHKAEIQKGLGKLETFLESIKQDTVKADIYEDVFTTSLQSILLERLNEFKKLLTILIYMKESLASYNCQSNDQTFLDHASQIECRLLNLLCDNLPEGLCCIDLKIKTIKSNSPVVYLCLAKEIVKFMHPVNTKVELISDDKVLEITGNYVKFSDFVYNEVAIHNKDLKEIHVFATQRIFLNEDFCDFNGRELEITLISPSIEIIGSRVITLNGKHGKNTFWSSANDGIKFGQDGENGLPGKPGGNGGHVYLICEQIINAGSLRVHVRGGNGGAGQNGGNGCCGAPGRSAEARDLTNEQTEKDGEPGLSGGNGGDGGMGGYPGYGGSVEVISLEKYDGVVTVIKDDGEVGMNGKGGSEGKGGLYGNGIRKIWGLLGTKTYPVPSTTRAPHGKPGRYGVNSTNQGLSPPKKGKPDSKATVISEVRKFYMNQSNNWSLAVTRQFLERIDLKLEFQHVTVKSLAQDLLNLELTLRNFHDPESMIRDHEEFQYRLLRYVHLVLSEEQHSENEDIKRVIQLLYAQSVSKVDVLKEYQGQGTSATGAQVINILGYFDIIKDTIDRLKESSLEMNRREALKTYHDHLKAKCEDTKDFISKIVLPSIAQAKRDIEEEINGCAGEVKSYGRMLEVDLRRKCEAAALTASAKVQFWEILKTVFTVLEYGIEIAQWFNYSAFATKALLGIAGFKRWIGNIGMDDDKSPKSIQHQSIQLPACLNDFHGTLEDKMTRMRKEWELVNKFVETHGDNHELESKMSRIKPNLEAWQDQLMQCQLLVNLMKAQKVALGEEFEKGIAGMEKSKTEVLNVFHETLEAKSRKDTLSSEMIDTIKHLLVSMAKENSDSTGKKSIVIYHGPSSPPTEPIVIVRGQLESVQEKYAAIFRDIMPLINAVFETVTPSLSQEPSSSQKLGEKWRIQTTLKKLKQNLANFFNGLESKTNLIQAIQRMEEGLSVLIDLYDMIDNYEESKLFSEALTGIKLNRNSKEIAHLQESVDKIGYLLNANTFILDYNHAVHAFQQWIFPFANKCPIPSLNFDDITDDLTNIKNHLNELAAEYKEQFSTIHGHLLRYRSMKMDFDDVVFRGIFSSRSSACPPFYVWKCEEWGNTITRFLKGEEVELRADLMKAEEFIERKLGAVKFKTVHLKIKHKNGMQEEEEKELDKIMKCFKITMVHSGISYYKVFNQCFVMRGSTNEYCYSFDGTTKNSTFEKSESQGDYLLSPFTIWKFQLNEIMQGAGGFERLNGFVGQVDLELWGDGLYLDERKAKQKKLDEKYLKDLHLHYELV